MAKAAGMQTPVAGTRFTVVDTELTGLDRRDSILSIGAVHMTGGRIELGDTFYRLVKPETELKAAGVVIHEITSEDLFEKPGIEQVLKEFSAFVGDSVILGYCIEIDMEFLNRELLRMAGVSFANHAIDIYPLYEWARSKSQFGERPVSMPGRAKLYDIARYYEIPVNGAHNALIDAFITAQVFQRLIPVLLGAGITEMGELVSLQKRLKGGDRLSLSYGLSNF